MGKGATSHPVTKSLPKPSKTRNKQMCVYPKDKLKFKIIFFNPRFNIGKGLNLTSFNSPWNIFLYSYMRIKCSEHAPIFSYWWSLLTNQLLIANNFVKLHGNQHNDDLHILEIHNQFLALSSFSFSYFLSWEYSLLACHVLCLSFPERCA